MNKHTVGMLSRLQSAGISFSDALDLRRIAMTLHRWSELECGDDNGRESFCIVRGEFRAENNFVYRDDGRPYMEVHTHNGAPVHYDRIPDREKGALKRLAAIMARYPALDHYVQGDPRGAPLYILRPGDVPAGEKADAFYSRGIAVHQ